MNKFFEQSIIILNSSQLKNKELVKQFISGGFKVIKNKKVPRNPLYDWCECEDCKLSKRKK